MCDGRQRAVSAGLENDIAERPLGPDVALFSGDGLICPAVGSVAFRGCWDTARLPDLRFEIGQRRTT
jgi:hypothetical protein